MTNIEFLKRVDELHRTLVDLTNSKGIEYANSDDQLANFKRLGQKLGVNPIVPCLIFLTKHLDAIDFYVKSRAEFVDEDRPAKFAPSSEPIKGRIIDAILYLLLLDAIIDEQNGGAT